MIQEQLKPLAGEIDRIYSSGGIQPRLLFSLTIKNPNSCGFDFANIRGSLYVEFSEHSDMAASQLGRFITDLTMERTGSPSIQPGDQNSLTLYLPVPITLLWELEEARNGLNLSFQIHLAYTLMERISLEAVALRVQSGELQGDSGRGFLAYVVAKSVWDDLLKNLGYSSELRATQKSITKIIEDIEEAKKKAEQWAEDTKQASMITAENTLSKVHQLEEKRLAKAARPWIAATLASGGVGVWVIQIFLHQSLMPQFGVSQAVLRVGVLSLIGYGFGSWFRLYKSYKHLELMSRHRANIGQTFAALLTAQPSPDAKNLLAGITAHQMVNFGAFGLAGKDTEDHQITTLVESMKSLIDTKRP